MAVLALCIAPCIVTLPAAVRAQDAQSTSGGASRDPWRFVPSVAVEQTWTDNVNLTSAGNKESEFITTISPGLRITRYGPRATLNFDYQPQYLYYARGTNGSTIRNYLSASADATVIENLLFFDALVSITQQNVSPFGTLSSNTVNNSQNRAETRNYSFGPTLRSRLGSDFAYSAGYRFTGSSSDNSAYSTNHTNQLFANFESGTGFRELGWGGDLDRTEQDFGGVNQIVTERVTGSLIYQLQPAFRLRGSIGYDRNRYPTTGQPDLSGPSYTGGFEWNPTRRTQVYAQVGHRYFGPTANISIAETHPRWALSAVYSRDQTTSAGSGLALVTDPNYALLDQFFRTTIIDPVARAQAVTSALTQAGLPTSQFGTTGFLSNQIYLQKRAQVTLALIGLRNTVTFDVYRTESRSLSSITTGLDAFDQAQSFRQTGATANWSHRLGPRTSANVGITRNNNKALVGTGNTKQQILTASVTRQIQPRLSGAVQYRNTRQDSDNAANTGFFSGNYRENAVLGSLRLTF